VPIPLLFGLLAEWITLSKAMLWVLMGATIVLIAVIWRLPPEKDLD
jgi:hypothetical protein